MSEELKRCPFCGEIPETDGRLVQCYLMPCDARHFIMPVKSWQKRPIEDALNKRIAELEKFTDQLIEAGDWELRSLCAFLDYTEDACTYKYYDPYGAIRGWSALVKSWKEREE